MSSAPDSSQQPKANIVVQYFRDFAVLKETRKEYWGLQVINMLDSLAYFAMFNIAVVTLSKDFGFNDVEAGLIYTLFSSLTTIFLFISGVITDWLGIKRALFVAVLGLLGFRVAVVGAAYMGEHVRMYDDTAVSILNDHSGLPDAPGADLSVTTRSGSSFSVELSGATTISDVMARVEDASSGNLHLDLAAGGLNFNIIDTSTDAETGTLHISGPAAAALGLEIESESAEVIGRRVITPLDGVLLSEVNRGAGATGALTLTDAGGHSATAQLDPGKTVRQNIAIINDALTARDVALKASINNAGTGLRVADPAGDSGTVVASGPGAEALRMDGQEAGGVTGKNLMANPIRNWIVILALAAMAPFMSMLQTVFQAGNRRFTTSRSRGAGFNLWYLFMNVGAAGGGFLIDIIYLHMDLPHFHVFTFGVITGVLELVVLAATIHNTDQLRIGEEEEEEAKAPEERKNPLQIIRAVVSETAFWRFTILITLLLGVRAVFLYLGLLHPKFWYRVIGPEAQVGALQAFNPILVIIGLILIIPILNKFNVYKMLVFGAMITSLSMFILAIPPMFGVDVALWTYGTTIAFLLVLTIGELIWSPRLQEYTAAIAPEGQEGTYLGLSMVPYFLAKIVVSGLSGAMLNRWCPAPPEDNPLLLQQKIASGDLSFFDSPYFMFTILGAVALIGTLAAIAGKPFFTKDAKF